ncbi:hypothetical protein [Streptomyces sp. NPDC057854]|uniref:hypothetical protein n=1 Tax=unclassified Streptomyces TaxID=2593676 RepID=UPI0036C992D1
MKIRRILATAVAAAVTTPVVFLSAGTAVADTRPTADASAQDAQTAQDGPDDADFAEYERLVEAVIKAEEKVERLKAEREALLEDLLANNVDPEIKAEYDEAKLAYDEAKAAREAADTAVTEAQAELDALTADPEASAEDKAAAEQTLAEATETAATALAAEKDAKTRFDAADTARDDALVAMSRETERLKAAIKTAQQELADAEAALEAYEGEGADCTDEEAVATTLTGPKTIVVGSSADFTLTVKNIAEHDLDAVRFHVFAAHVPESWSDIIGAEDPDFAQYIDVDWKSAANPVWTDLDMESESIDLGKIAEGGRTDVTLRLTVADDAPAGEGIAFTAGEYENEDGSCGVGQGFAKVDFDVVEQDAGEPTEEPADEPTEEPTEEPTSEPSPSASTPAPAATTANTTQQGGSSNTPVATGGQLAATGANDTLPRLGAAAGAALVLGAGAVFAARRRKVNG